MEANELLALKIVDFSILIVFVIAFLVLWFFPPKKRNILYGYRTANSMKSEENWWFANNTFKKLLPFGILAFGLMLYIKAVFFKTYLSTGMNMFITLILSFLVVILPPMIYIEYKLKNK